MKLLIDIGNTSTKYAVTQGEEMLLAERLFAPWVPVLQRICAQYDIERIVVSCVGQKDELTDALDRLGLTAAWLTHTTPCAIGGIPAGYGADRLAADIGAYSGQHALLVIDAGTCITYDLIVDGRLEGGVISPGVQLRLNAMHDYTTALPHISALEAEDTIPLLGNDTRSCMLSAAIRGASFEAEGYIRSLLAEHPDLYVITTGGNPLEIPNELPHTYDPLLVIRGLNKI